MDITAAIIAVISALLGGGGYAAYIRARGQNKVDLVTVLTDRVHNLENRIYEQDFRNTNLVIENAKHAGTISALEADIRQYIKDLATRTAELDQMKLEKAGYMLLVEEAASLRQKLQILQSQEDWMNTEATTLNAENQELKAKTRNG